MKTSWSPFGTAAISAFTITRGDVNVSSAIAGMCASKQASKESGKGFTGDSISVE
ncbi:hypothetical protein [Rubripirellula lacrimiformis]|uniref:hypothetical protein n=1 Tax=Rubripirellula lacrimiformis TaxID=1930273 RepID=UPI001C54C468|nr:hypothetical protein [Rubripirellula lacrimiformis]